MKNRAIACLILGLPGLLHAAIVVSDLGNDLTNFSSNPTGAGAESLTWNTPSDPSDVSSANDALVIAVAAKWNMTGITVNYGATPMTLAASVYGNPLDSQNLSAVWYLLNPGSAGLDFTVNWNNTHGTGRNDDIYLRAFYLDGVKQEAPEKAQTSTASNTSTSLTHGGFTTGGAFVMDVVALNNSAISSTAPTGGLGQNAVISNANGARAASSYLIAPFGANVSSTWTYAANSPPKSAVIVAFGELGSSAIPEPSSLGLILMGLGVFAKYRRQTGKPTA